MEESSVSDVLFSLLISLPIYPFFPSPFQFLFLFAFSSAMVPFAINCNSVRYDDTRNDIYKYIDGSSE